jgi:uncharacterized protein
MPRRALIVMAKQPAPGTTKTRLSPPLSLDEAAALYACFLADVLDTAREVMRTLPDLTPYIAFTPPSALVYFHELAPDFALLPQTGPTLGERLDGILSTTLAQGYDQVAAINSDSPSLPATYLVQAFAALDDPSSDVIFGPCEDGGYYLIGLRRPQPRLVREVRMSTPDTLADTLLIAAEMGLRVELLPTWYDVDRAIELERLIGDPNLGRHTREFLAR